MDAIQRKIDALTRFKTEKGILLMQLIQEFDYIAIDMNVEDQLFERGIDSKGNKIYPEYSPVTVMLKTIKRQPTDRVTLRDTGAFHRSFRIEANEFNFTIVAEDLHLLQYHYGEDIIGLTDENLSIFIQEYIFPELFKILMEWLEN